MSAKSRNEAVNAGCVCVSKTPTTAAAAAAAVVHRDGTLRGRSMNHCWSSLNHFGDGTVLSVYRYRISCQSIKGEHQWAAGIGLHCFFYWRSMKKWKAGSGWAVILWFLQHLSSFSDTWSPLTDSPSVCWKCSNVIRIHPESLLQGDTSIMCLTNGPLPVY